MRPGASITAARLVTIGVRPPARAPRPVPAQSSREASTPSPVVRFGSSCSIEIGVRQAGAVQGLDQGHPVGRRVAVPTAQKCQAMSACAARGQPKSRLPVMASRAGSMVACPCRATPADEAVQRADDPDRVHALPPEVAGVQVDQQVVPGNLAQQQERLGVVDRGARCSSRQYPHPGRGRGGPAGQFPPVRLDPLAPLPVPQPFHVGQPGARRTPASHRRPGRRGSRSWPPPSGPRDCAPAARWPAGRRRACGLPPGPGCSGLPGHVERAEGNPVPGQLAGQRVPGRGAGGQLGEAGVRAGE